jgi:hypothetical protein
MKANLESKLDQPKRFSLRGTINTGDERFGVPVEYNLKINGCTVSGTVQAGAVHSSNILDDEDASDYEVQAEVEAVRALERQLAAKYPNRVFTGTVLGKGQHIYEPDPRQYSFSSEVKECPNTE